MSNNSLLATMNETYNELAQKRADAIGKVTQRVEEVQILEAYLSQAKNQRDLKQLAKNELEKNQKELITFINSLSDKPQAVVNKIGRLNDDALRARQELNSVEERVEQLQRELSTAKLQQQLEHSIQSSIEKDLQDISEHIRNLQSIN